MMRKLSSLTADTGAKITDETDVIDEITLKQFLLNRASNSRRLYHYTTYESLLKILSGKSLQLTRMDLLNDLAETKFGAPMDENTYYVICFTGRRESVAMWEMYGNPGGIKLRIDFGTKNFMEVMNNYYYVDSNNNNKKVPISKPKKLVNIEPPLFSDRVVFADVAYCDTEGSILRHNEKEFKELSLKEIKYNNMRGFIKFSAWEYEKERRVRIRIMDRTGGQDSYTPKHIYIGLNKSLIQDIHVTYNPWMSRELKNEITKSLNSIAETELEFSDSDIDGQVRL